MTPSVGLYTYSTLPRGSVVHTAALADALADAGCDVTVHALSKDGRGFFRPLRARLELVATGPAPPSTAALVRLRAWELAEHIAARGLHDIHHAEDCLTANGLLEARAQGASFTLVRTVHHVERFEDPVLARCQERSIREADLCLTVSEAARRDVARCFGARCAVVGNGVDVDRFREVDPARAAAWRARMDRGRPAVLAVGGVEKRKNTLRVLRAFARLRETAPAATLYIMGGATVLDHGGYRRAFDRARDRLPGDTRAAVVELGVVDHADVPAIFQQADVLAAPSLHEGFGLAALEALAAGLPVVGADRPPMTEFLDATCATLVDPMSDEAIAAGLVAALDAAPDRRVAGRRRAEAHSWSAVAARHLEAYGRRTTHARDALLGSVA
jgi:glycosyltransferase-like protein